MCARKEKKWPPFKGSNGEARLATLLNEREVGLLLLLETGLDQVEGLDKDACTETRDCSADQVGNRVACFLFGGHVVRVEGSWYCKGESVYE